MSLSSSTIASSPRPFTRLTKRTAAPSLSVPSSTLTRVMCTTVSPTGGRPPQLPKQPVHCSWCTLEHVVWTVIARVRPRTVSGKVGDRGVEQPRRSDERRTRRPEHPRSSTCTPLRLPEHGRWPGPAGGGSGEWPVAPPLSGRRQRRPVARGPNRQRSSSCRSPRPPVRVVQRPQVVRVHEHRRQLPASVNLTAVVEPACHQPRAVPRTSPRRSPSVVIAFPFIVAPAAPAPATARDVAVLDREGPTPIILLAPLPPTESALASLRPTRPRRPPESAPTGVAGPAGRAGTRAARRRR